MITPEIQGYFSTDVPDLEKFTPASLGQIHFPLEMSIGVKGEKGGDQFQVLVASPEALRARAKDQTCDTRRHCLIVFKYDWKAIRKTLEKIVSDCAAPTWEEAAQKLSRHFQWEYEDYVEEKG
jgi:hypothetical protein